MSSIKNGRQKKERLHKESEGRCYWCGRETKLVAGQHEDELATIDHVIPRVLGGTNANENIVLSCRKCNAEKGTDVPYSPFGINLGDEIKKALGDKLLQIIGE